MTAHGDRAAADWSERALIAALIDAAHAAISGVADELTALDRAIGDGDHGRNMRRGVEALRQARDEIAALPFGEAMRRAGDVLVRQVGGASGPLYGTFLMAIGDAHPRPPADVSETIQLISVGLDAVKARGKCEVGAKTLIDVLAPVRHAVGTARPDDAALRARVAAEDGLNATRQMRALTGRASYLGERSIGHLDPGARSAAALVGAVCDVVEGKRPATTEGPALVAALEAAERRVAIVIVSQSPLVARGAAEMVREMVGDAAPVAACGGDVEGRLGADVAAIRRAIEEVYSPAGVAVLVDLGGAESNAEMAIEMLSPKMAANIRICDAPIVEGAVMAAAMAAGGAPLDRVCATAEEFRS